MRSCISFPPDRFPCLKGPESVNLALQVALALSTSAPAIDVTLATERVGPGAMQTAVVSGLDPGDWFGAAWVDPTGRVRGSWDARAGRRGEKTVTFRTREALAGTHRFVAWSSYGEKEVSTDKQFEVLPGGPPPYLLAIDPGRSRPAPPGPDNTPGNRAPGRPSADLPAGHPVALVSSGPRTPDASLGWVVRILKRGPPFLRLDEQRLRERRSAYEESRAEELLERPACLHEPSSLVSLWRWAGPRAEEAARARPWLWSMGRNVRLADEDGRLDFCRSKQSTREFVRVLSGRHADLESLNRRWGTAFARWEDVRAPATRELLEKLRNDLGRSGRSGAPEEGPRGSGALRWISPASRGMLAAWSDHRSFLDGTWCEQVSCVRDLLRSTDERASAGLEGVSLPGVFTGSDPARLLGSVDWVELPDRRLDVALARSFAAKGSRILTRLEGADPASGLLRGLVNGHTGAILHAGGLPETADADAEARPPVPLERVLETVSGGLGALLARTRWEHDPVVVLYSHRSVQIEWALTAAVARSARAAPDAPATGRIETQAGRALGAWAALLSDVGIAARFISSKELAGGALPRLRARVLILPRAYLISGKELTEITRFARRGGLVVADACAGLLDERFRTGPEYEIDDLFGIVREPLGPTERQTGEPPRTAAGDRITLTGTAPAGSYVDGVDVSCLRLAEPDVRARSGHALVHRADGAVGLVANSCGRGSGVFLNLAIETYAAVSPAQLGAGLPVGRANAPGADSPAGRAGARRSSEGAGLRRLVRNVLELGQVRPRVEVVSRGVPVAGYERSYRGLEEMEIVALWRDRASGAGPVDAELVFDGRGHCYDVLDGVKLGDNRRVRVRLRAGPHVFARLPYEVEGIAVKASMHRGEVRYRATVETPTGLAGTHVLHRELVRPIPGGSADLLAYRGVVKGSVTLAENEPAGKYALVFRDAATGVVTEMLITKDDSPLGGRFPLERKPKARTR
jgi:hypothetical protein